VLPSYHALFSSTARFAHGVAAQKNSWGENPAKNQTRLGKSRIEPADVLKNRYLITGPGAIVFEESGVIRIYGNTRDLSS
jgi:hypothetical protein